MAGHATSSDGGIITGINVTPLVDVMLVLLILFIVTAKTVTQSAVPLDLPRASRSEGTQVVFAVTVPATGPLRINDTLAEQEDVFLRLAREGARQDADLRVVIQAEGAVPHRRVLHVLDLLQQAGLSRIAFAAIPVPSP